MTGITKQDGPVAVTGASGYIGSRIVEDLLEQGYEVHACVRDASNGKKVDGFPVYGNGAVDLSNSDKDKALELLVTAEDNSLLVYEIN